MLAGSERSSPITSRNVPRIASEASSQSLDATRRRIRSCSRRPGAPPTAPTARPALATPTLA